MEHHRYTSVSTTRLRLSLPALCAVSMAVASAAKASEIERNWFVLLASQRDFSAAVSAAEKAERSGVRWPLTFPRVDLSTRYQGFGAGYWIVVGAKYQEKDEARAMVARLKAKGLDCYAKAHAGWREETDTFSAVRTFSAKPGGRVPAYEGVGEEARQVVELPDGMWLRVASATLDDPEQLPRYQVELGQPARRLWVNATDAYGDCEVAPSPAGDHAVLSFLTGCGADSCGARSFLIDRGGKVRVRLADGYWITADWSPNGQWVVYDQGSYNPEIRKIRANGADLETMGSGGSPVWSPDGREIWYRERAFDRDAVCRMTAIGIRDHEVLALPGRPVYHLQWGEYAEPLEWLDGGRRFRARFVRANGDDDEAPSTIEVVATRDGEIVSRREIPRH